VSALDPVNDSTAPLLDALKKHHADTRFGFHTPGHQSGSGLYPAFHRLLDLYGAALDLTELAGLDNRALPEGVIEASQKAMAQIAGSKSSYYLVNGASGGLEAAMLTLCEPGSLAYVPAHSHASIHHGLILTGAMPVILPTLIDRNWRLPLGIDLEAAATFVAASGLDASLNRALWISVNPTYHGIMADLSGEKEVLEKYSELAWLVDEAHGAHLPFVNPVAGDNRISYSALHQGADIVVQSIHKMGTGFTQTGVLHCNRSEHSSRLRQAINLTQSSSPSYLLMASMDAWQAFLSEDGRDCLKHTQNLACDLSERIRALGSYRLWRDEVHARYVLDDRKITLSPLELGISGTTLAEILRLEYGIAVEAAAPEHVLLIVNVGLEESEADLLIEALKKIKEKHPSLKTSKTIDTQIDTNGDYHMGLSFAQPVITPREAFFAQRESVRLEHSEGRISANAVMPYPPGIPLMFPGMEISREAIERVRELIEHGYPCAGVTQDADHYKHYYIDVVMQS